MQYVYMELNADTVGTTEIHYIEVPDDITLQEIDDVYRAAILDHAEGYGYDYQTWAEENVDDYDPDEDEEMEHWDDYEIAVMGFGTWDYLPSKPRDDEMGDSLYGLEPWGSL